MKTVTQTRFGSPDVLAVVEAPVPVPGPHDVLIKIRATTVTTAECLMRRGRPLWGRVIIGLVRPRRKLRTLGMELSGEVVAAGARVRRFRVGEEVFGFAGFQPGAAAEFHCLPETASLAAKPEKAGHSEAAAAVDGATTALYFLRDRAAVLAGERVLVNGASGSIGTYAVQLAKQLGAEVTAVCGARNAELVRSLGADHVIDYAEHDFTTDAGAYDVVFDTIGKSSFGKAKRAMTARGRYLSTTGLVNIFLAAWTALRPGRKVVTGMSVRKHDGLRHIRELIDTGRLTIVIDRVYPLERTAEAHRYVDSGHKVGNVVIEVDPVRS